MTAVETRARRGLVAPRTFDEVFDVPGSIRSMAVLRIVLAPIVVLHLLPFITDSLDGVTYLDRFNEPWFDVVPAVPGAVQIVVVWIGLGAAVAMGLGWQTRIAAPLTTVCVAANFFLSQTHFRHNRAFLLFLLAAVALSDSGRVLSLDSRRRASADDDRATLWPLWLLRIVASSVYLASGFSKLIDPDWAGGLVLWDRAVRHQQLVVTRVPEPVAGWVVDVVTQRWVHAVTSPIAVAMELFIGVALWFGRTRIVAIWVAVLFHLSIELSASVEVFSLAAIAALAIWATPSTRDRVVVVPDVDAARRIRRLDWLARFDVRVGPVSEIELYDRDAVRHSGREALSMIRSRLPLTFFFAAPLVLLRSRIR